MAKKKTKRGRPKGSKNKELPQQFCLRGHAISVVGRDKKGACKRCKMTIIKSTIKPM